MKRTVTSEQWADVVKTAPPFRAIAETVDGPIEYYSDGLHRWLVTYDGDSVTYDDDLPPQRGMNMDQAFGVGTHT